VVRYCQEGNTTTTLENDGFIGFQNLKFFLRTIFAVASFIEKVGEGLFVRISVLFSSHIYLKTPEKKSFST